MRPNEVPTMDKAGQVSTNMDLAAEAAAQRARIAAERRRANELDSARNRVPTKNDLASRIGDAIGMAIAIAIVIGVTWLIVVSGIL